MNRLQLVYKSVGEIVGSEELAVITLTDTAEQRAINFVCDNVTKCQLQMHTLHNSSCYNHLPEVLLSMLNDYVKSSKMEMVIYDIKDGQYQVTLMNVDTFSIRKIRMSDAVLLSMISDVPLYIDGALMEQQSIPFQEANTRVSIPINTLDIDKLKEALDKAVDEENYRLASVIKDELGRREKAKREGRI